MELTEPSIAAKEPSEGPMAQGENTGVPRLLKLALAAIVAGCTAYFFMLLNGGSSSASRGALARAMDAATQTSAALMYAMTALIVIYGLIVVAGAVRERH